MPRAEARQCEVRTAVTSLVEPEMLHGWLSVICLMLKLYFPSSAGLPIGGISFSYWPFASWTKDVRDCVRLSLRWLASTFEG